MKWKSTAVLLGCLVVAAIIAYSLSRQPTSDELRKQQTNLIPRFSQEQVSSITIATEGVRLTIERSETDKDEWLITEPIKARADRWEVEGIIRKFETATKKYSQYPDGEEPLDLKKYELTEPKRQITFRQSGVREKTWTVRIGRKTGVSDTVYAALESEDAIHSIEEEVAQKCDVTLNDVRSKKIMPRIDVFALNGVTLSAEKWGESPGFKVACVREDDVWELREPVKDRADQDKVKELARKVNQHSLTKDDFVVDDPTKAAEYGLDKPSLSVTYRVGETVATILLGKKSEDDEKKVYAMTKGEPAIFAVPVSLVDDLHKEPDELRSRSLADFDKDNARKVTITRGGRSLVLEKEEGKWKIAGDAPADADGLVMGSLLDGLKDATVGDFVNDKPTELGGYGLSEKDRRKVVVTGEEGKELGAVSFGGQDKEGAVVYVQRPPYVPVLSIEKNDYVDDVKGGRLAFLNRTILEEPVAKALTLEIKRGKELLVCARENTDAEWKLTNPVKALADGSAVSNILYDFRDLKALGFAAEKAETLAEYGLEKPAITVSVTYESKDDEDEEGGAAAEAEEKEPEAVAKTYTRQVAVGAEAKGYDEGCYAMLKGDPRVFVMPGGTVEDLRANLGSKLVSKMEDLKELKFLKGATTLAFSYDEEKAAWARADGKEPPEEVKSKLKAIVRLVERFEGLRVEAFSVGVPAKYGFDKPLLTIEAAQKTVSGSKKITVGKQVGEEGYYVKGTVTDFVLVVSKDDVEKLLAVAAPPEKAGGEAPAEPKAKPK